MLFALDVFTTLDAVDLTPVDIVFATGFGATVF